MPLVSAIFAEWYLPTLFSTWYVSECHGEFWHVVFNMVRCPMLPGVIFNVQMLKATRATFKNNDDCITLDSSVNPIYCYIFSPDMTSFRSQISRCFQHAHVAYVHPVFDHVTPNILRWVMLAGNTPRCACSSQLSDRFPAYCHFCHLSPKFWP